jgi:hypothetical protein
MLKTHFLVFLLLFSSVGAILAALGQFPTAGPGGLMLNKILRTCALAGWFSVAISGAAAQEIIHVYAGIVSEVDAGSQTITVASNDGSQQIFNYTADAKSVALINKKMREGVVAVNTVKEKGTYVIVYYFISGRSRTAVGVRNLGVGPFVEEIGTVVIVQDRTIVIRNKSGALRTFGVRPGMIAESSLGPVDGRDFLTEKGSLVRIIATATDEGGDALFIDGTVVD